VVEHARVATAADIRALEALRDQAVAELHRERGGALLVDSVVSSEPPDGALRRALDDPERLVVLGTLDGVEVGFASVRRDAARSQPIGVIEGIYVEPSARQIGVGEAMVDLVRNWCWGRGCRGIDAPALPGSRAAKAFFEDHGFVARLLVMHHSLTAPRGGELD
jgi:GNAT superfamily N-acetyltransferase